MKFLTKKIFITTLSVLLLSVLAFACLFSQENSFATATEESKLEPTALFSASSSASISSDNGVRISSDAAYTGEISGVFKGDTKLKFKFPETLAEGETWYGGNFVVRVTDVDDDSNYFEVKYTTVSEQYKYTGAFVFYKDQIRTSQYWGGATNWSNKQTTGGYALAAPIFLNETTGAGGWTARDGELSFLWDNDVLSVKINNAHNAGERVIAAFDGTDNFASGSAWGLPKLSFKNGYKISFSSSFENDATTDRATDVCFTSVETGSDVYALTATEISLPDFYIDYLQMKSQRKTVATSITDLVETSGNVSVENGLRISSDTPYNATVKGVFKGDAKLKFKFPETLAEGETWYGGNFVVRVTDVDDENNYFEVKYIADTNVTYRYTFAYVFYKDQIRTSQYYSAANNWSNTQKTGAYALAAPLFLNEAHNGTARDGELSFLWDNDVLSVKINNSHNTGERVIAAFDGTNEFAQGTSWGLPKLNFKNGYVISFSSSFSNENTTDQATDVTFIQITNGNTYDLTGETICNDKIQEFSETFATSDDVVVENGKVFLGWKEKETGKLYSTSSVVKKADYEAVCISFANLYGASVRLDTSENGKSGIRFTALFDPTELAGVKDYIDSFGILVASTEALKASDKEFTIENFDGGTLGRKVENTTGTYTYDNTYAAYSVAIAVREANYTKSYSARGYLVVKHADDSTQTIYADYNETDNARSITDVAQRLKQIDPDTYNGMTKAQQDIIDAYIAAQAK